MMKKTVIAAGIAALVLCCSCSRNEDFETETVPSELLPDTAGRVPGVLNVRVSENLYGNVAVSDEAAIRAFGKIGATSVRRLFPDNGFPERTRKAGLHLWYRVDYDASLPMTRAYGDACEIEGVDYVEFCPETVHIGPRKGEVADMVMTRASSNAVFDDPGLSTQWHYINDGSTSGAVSGCDVNVLPVWQTLTTGNGEVIVAVIDEGVDYSHEDLAANMWHNPEQTGDRVYGYNFVSGGYRISPGDHGTHVAGTIAAVNNNGKGVCGIAGGNAAKNVKGVKIMSCQIFEEDKGAPGATAIKWAADHGAVIAQNSWGYDVTEVHKTPQADKAAIDYFNTYAGCDDKGQQLASSPMKGGVVIFAAGNDNCTEGYPAEYEGAVAVAALGSNFKRATYSCYGSWVDISAPGGDVDGGCRQIYSTLPGNQYGYMQGTSMACPHVSGVAALVVSHYAAKGFSAATLKKSLQENTRDINSYNASFKGLLGSGLADANKAVLGISSTPPNPVTEMTLSASSNLITAHVKVPADKEVGKAFGITLYYSKEQFTKSSEAEGFVDFEVGEASVGSFIDCQFFVPEFNATYYVEAKSYNPIGIQSALSSLKKNVTTGGNHNPVITPVSGTELTLKQYQTGALDFIVTDEDRHSVSLTMQPEMEGFTLVQVNDTLFRLTVEGVKTASGKYAPVLTASDGFGGTSSVTVSVTVQENHAPVVLKQIPDIIFSAVGEKRTLNLTEYFADEDGEPLSYQVSTESSVCHLSVSENTLYATSMAYGSCDLSVTATDAKGASCTSSFRELTRDQSVEVDIYPVPVKDGRLYFRCSETRSAQVELYSSTGSRVFSASVQIEPFAPACIDISSLVGGTYKCRLKFDNGTTYEKSIVKL